MCTVNSVLSPFICLIFDSNPITFSTDQSSLSLPSWLAIIISKYFVIPSDLFLAVMPGQWYTEFGYAQTCNHRNNAAYLSLFNCDFLMTSVTDQFRKNIFYFWLSTGMKQTVRLLQRYLGQGEREPRAHRDWWDPCPLVSFSWLTMCVWEMLLSNAFPKSIQYCLCFCVSQ